MNFLGIGFGELILILIVLLVVVGPERLPELSRQAGRLMVRARTWIQSSPDAALVLRARQEIEQELEAIKSSLLEVQSVRDEVLGAARQLNDSVSPLTSGRLSIDEIMGTPATAEVEHVVTANGQLTSDVPLAVPAAESAAPTSAPIREPFEEPVDRAPDELEQLNFRLQALMTDLWALQEQLKQRGVLEPGWTPPSFTVQLPDSPQAAPDSQHEEVT